MEKPHLTKEARTNKFQTLENRKKNRNRLWFSQGPLKGGFQTGGFPDLDLSFLLSFLGLSRFFWDFPDLLGDGPGIFPICPFPLPRPIKSTYEEQSRKGPRHNLDLSRKVSGKPPGLETPRFSFSQFFRAIFSPASENRKRNRRKIATLGALSSELVRTVLLQSIRRDELSF